MPGGNEHAAASGEIKTGVVKWFSPKKGIGFIKPTDGSGEGRGGGADVFVHQSAIKKDGFRTLGVGERVEYRTGINPKTGKVFAAEVTGPGGGDVVGSPKRKSSRGAAAAAAAAAKVDKPHENGAAAAEAARSAGAAAAAEEPAQQAKRIPEEKDSTTAVANGIHGGGVDRTTANGTTDKSQAPQAAAAAAGNGHHHPHFRTVTPGDDIDGHEYEGHRHDYPKTPWCGKSSLDDSGPSPAPRASPHAETTLGGTTTPYIEKKDRSNGVGVVAAARPDDAPADGGTTGGDAAGQQVAKDAADSPPTANGVADGHVHLRTVTPGDDIDGHEYEQHRHDYPKTHYPRPDEAEPVDVPDEEEVTGVATEHELGVIEVADSRFVGFVRRTATEAQAMRFQSELKGRYTDAAHVPVAWRTSDGHRGFVEDGEPENSAGPFLCAMMDDASDGGALSEEIEGGLTLAVVRYFGGQLLGVTCGRLSQCYGSVARLALHRFAAGLDGEPMVEEILSVTQPIYGLAAGDTEVIPDVISDPRNDLLSRIVSEVEFGGFRGSAGEELPRKQNLQADGVRGGIVPVYRYPGNYSGDEWETFEWSPSTLEVKEAVEEGLLPLVEQKMNHCVANLYSKGDDFIDHHSDKVLDLDRAGVIVSVSLGEERILELRRRAEPRDTTRIELPHCSMLVLGPKTNQLFTHSILKKENSTGPRLSLTLRNVKTFLDVKTGRLFGQGVAAKSVEETRRREQVENGMLLVGTGALASLVVSSARASTKMKSKQGLILCSVLAAASLFSLRAVGKSLRKRGEEREARTFFSRASVSGTKY